jgi:hypothetical protein
VPDQGYLHGVPLRMEGNGELLVGAEGGEVIFHKPIVYQPATNHGRRTADKYFVDGKYALKGERVIFEVANYDKTKPLVIDPSLAYSTYLGGSDYDLGKGIAVDASGNAYVAGITPSSDFPSTPGAFQTKNAGGSSGCCGDRGDAFVSKLNDAGSALVYSTYLGGSGDDGAYGITVDAIGNVYVTGQTFSSDFPTTRSAFRTTGAGGGDAFVSKLNDAGSALVYSTYLGGY